MANGIKSVLVTGAAGFLGSNFVRLLLKHHGTWDVVALDLCSYSGNLANLEGCFDDSMFEFVKGDVCDFALLDCLMCDIDVVVNFAAETNIDRSVRCPADCMRTNVEGTRALADAAVRHNIKKFIQISTDETYGPIGDNEHLKEDSALRPTSPYAASKASADLLLMAHHSTYGMPAIILRPCDNYGPYQFPDKLIPLFITNLIQDKHVPLYGDGMQMRDWLYVEDTCFGILKAIEKGVPGEIYNLSGHNEFANIDIARMIISFLGKDDSYIDYVAQRPGHDRRYALDPSKANAQLDWHAKTEFVTGLQRTIEWYLNNQDWWRGVQSGEYISYYESQYSARAIVKR